MFHLKKSLLNPLPLFGFKSSDDLVVVTLSPELCPLLQPENTALQNMLISTSGRANPICFLRGTFRPPLKFTLI